LRNLENTAKDFSMKISAMKTKIMASLWTNSSLCKICTYSKVTEQVNVFKYLGYCKT